MLNRRGVPDNPECYSHLMEPCVFCAIATYRTPATIIDEDELTLAFVPFPQAVPGHTLLIPRQHFETIFDIDSEVLMLLISKSQVLAGRLIREHQATGVNLLHSSGRDAQQSVMHFHLHLIPRKPGDQLDIRIRQGL